MVKTLFLVGCAQIGLSTLGGGVSSRRRLVPAGVSSRRRLVPAGRPVVVDGNQRLYDPLHVVPVLLQQLRVCVPVGKPHLQQLPHLSRVALAACLRHRGLVGVAGCQGSICAGGWGHPVAGGGCPAVTAGRGRPLPAEVKHTSTKLDLEFVWAGI